ncbi:hypothetical protein MBLNU459_g4901t2 [Dothideomycetes sp. NU459]
MSCVDYNEAFYYAVKSHAIAVLTSDAAMGKGVALEKLVKTSDSMSTFSCIPIAPAILTSSLEPSMIKTSSDKYLDDNAPAVVIFTSGTTGPPKGSVMRRAYVFDCALGVADHYKVCATDVLLHLLPVHHATGVGIMFFPFLISGATIEFRSGSFDPAWTWERWRKQGLTFFSGVPTIYTRMMHYFERHLKDQPNAMEYVNGARSLRACLCGTSALPSPIADFWTRLLGKKILLRYGGTEFGAVLKVQMGDDMVPDGSVGEVFPGVEMKLSDDAEGEILIKSPYMFSKYLNDADATAKAHDQEGYYKTGDIARREGKYFWILGRASVDIIKSGGYKISALDIEREILGLPYVSEVMVVGVADDEFGQRVAAAVVLKEDRSKGGDARGNQGYPLVLHQLRKDLEFRLARYKMPTLLRLVEGELPKSATGKVSKKVLGPQMFPRNYRSIGDVQVWDRNLNYDISKVRL